MIAFYHTVLKARILTVNPSTDTAQLPPAIDACVEQFPIDTIS